MVAAVPALTAAEAALLTQIEPQEVIELLQGLIRARSDSPPGDTRAAVAVAAAPLRAAGVRVQVVAPEDAPAQASLLARLGDGGPLALHAHLDTVPAGEIGRWTVDPFAGLRRDGRVYGRGAGDDKGSAAAQIMALTALARAGVKLARGVQGVWVADEEAGGLQGTHWLRRSDQVRPAALVVGEQTDNRVAVGERVAVGIDLTVFGVSAHGAMPWAGENAVLKAARALTYLFARLEPLLAARQGPYLPPPTLNIGRIRGGIQWSIVPERCVVEMDRRLLPGETRESAMGEIRALLEAFAAEVEPLRFELFSQGEVAPNIDTDPAHPFVALAQAALADAAGERRALTGYAQTSDGRWFAGDGIPIILFGPGDPALAHAADEWVAEAQVVEAARMCALLAARWAAA